jgi:hypothetical protein
MATPPDNRIILAIGAGLAVVAAIVLALIFTRGGDGDAAPDGPRGNLQVDVAEPQSLEPTRELRCFVEGQFVGMLTLDQCAQRNGLATEALDVGLDETGALIAAPTASLAPPPTLPPIEVEDVPPIAETPVERAEAPSGPTASCLRHSGSDWRSMSSSIGLEACVQILYSGTCVRPGEARYGRWGDLTLRLVPGRVEQSSDNSNFRTLAEQDRRTCTFPEFG